MTVPKRRFKIEKLEDRVVPGFMSGGCFFKSDRGGFGGFQSQSQFQAQFQSQSQSQVSSISISVTGGGTLAFTGGGSISIVIQ